MDKGENLTSLAKVKIQGARKMPKQYKRVQSTGLKRYWIRGLSGARQKLINDWKGFQEPTASNLLTDAANVIEEKESVCDIYSI